MPGVSIGIQFTNGFAGQVSRQGPAKSRTRAVDAASENIYFGDPVVINPTGTVSKFGAGNTAAQFAGVAMRRVKANTTYPPTSSVYYGPGDNCDILEEGDITVTCRVGTPTVGGTVYVRTALNASIPAGVVGGFEAAPDGTNTVQLTNAHWGTTADANGTAELVIQTNQGV